MSYYCNFSNFPSSVFDYPPPSSFALRAVSEKCSEECLRILDEGVKELLQARDSEPQLVWVSYSLSENGSIASKEVPGFYGKSFAYVVDSLSYFQNKYSIVSEFFDVHRHEYFTVDKKTGGNILYSQKILAPYGGWLRDGLFYIIPFPDTAVAECEPFDFRWRFEANTN